MGFLGGCTQKNTPGFFWVRTRVSEPCCYVAVSLLIACIMGLALPSVRPSVLCGLLVRKRWGAGNPKFVWAFPRAWVTVVPIFSWKGQRSGGRPHNASALGRQSFIVNTVNWLIAFVEPTTTDQLCAQSAWSCTTRIQSFIATFYIFTSCGTLFTSCGTVFSCFLFKLFLSVCKFNRPLPNLFIFTHPSFISYLTICICTTGHINTKTDT